MVVGARANGMCLDNHKAAGQSLRTGLCHLATLVLERQRLATNEQTPHAR